MKVIATIVIFFIYTSHSWSADTYDQFFKNEFLNSVGIKEDSLNLLLKQVEHVWNRNKKDWEYVNEKTIITSIPNPGVNDRWDIYTTNDGLRRNIIKTNNGVELYVGKDFSKNLTAERIDIQSVKGNIPSFFYKKKNASLKRIVVYVHGGSFISCLRDDIFHNAELHFLMENDTGIYAINTTGDFDCKDKYSEYPNRHERPLSEWATTEIDDIFKAYGEMKTRNPEIPILLAGFSHGSYLTNLIASKYASESPYSGYISMFGAWDNSQDDGYSHAAAKGRLAVSDRHFSQDDCRKCQKGFKSAFTYKPSVTIEHGKTVKMTDDKLTHEEAVIRLKEIRKTEDVDYLYYYPLDSFYERTNPSLFIKEIDRPLLSVHGQQDRSVYVFNSDVLKNGLLPHQKVYVEVVKYEEEGHGLFTRENFNDFTQKLLNFIEHFDIIEQEVNL